MFVFDNLIDIEDKFIQLILKETDTASLTIALKGATEDLREKFYRNMSTRAAEMLRDDLDAQGPVRMSRVEQEQKNILQIARKLAEAGQITLDNPGRSEEHTSELQSPMRISYAVFCLKKKQTNTHHKNI